MCVEQGTPADEAHALFALSKVLYESGNYSLASVALKVYRKCSPSSGPEALGALWGKFAADIMAGNWEDANTCRMDVSSALDRSSSPKHVTQAQRAWALHWSLFVFFCRPAGSGGMESLVEYFLMDS